MDFRLSAKRHTALSAAGKPDGTQRFFADESGVVDAGGEFAAFFEGDVFFLDRVDVRQGGLPFVLRLRLVFQAYRNHRGNAVFFLRYT